MRTKICLSILAFICVGMFSPPSVVQAVTSNFPEPQTDQIFRCTIGDPTGTPLNVRSSPGGKKIVAKLKNGTTVFVENFSGDSKDQSWAEVKLSSRKGTKPLGWVLQDFLDCKEL